MISLLGDKVPNKNFPHYIKLYNECKPIDYSKIAGQFCAVFLEKGGLAPFGKIDVVNFSYPRWAREITVDTAFRGRNCNGYVP